MSEIDPKIEKISLMLSMQGEMNSRVDRDWLSRDREWYRAIWIECAELMDHYGDWKWWKHSEPDFDQVLLEIVDIWHFGLSQRIQGDGNHRRTAADIAREWDSLRPALPFLEEVERLAHAALAEKLFAVDSIRKLLEACGRDFDDLYRSYVGKNVLNVFRQDHGYKTGDYVKIWDGREDNVVLSELIAGLDSDDARFRDAVYRSLKTRYEEIGNS